MRSSTFLQSALNIEDGIEELRYNNVVIATDADVDGMHITVAADNLFPSVFSRPYQKRHLYILQTPLFRVRNKTKTIYCYSEAEKEQGCQELGGNPEITRFKGLGEISPDEFRHFIGKDMRLEPVQLKKEDMVTEMLAFYMGKNSPERQDFIIENLRVD
jgi:topoisomerase IV subunit B